MGKADVAGPLARGLRLELKMIVFIPTFNPEDRPNAGIIPRFQIPIGLLSNCITESVAV